MRGVLSIFLLCLLGIHFIAAASSIQDSNSHFLRSLKSSSGTANAGHFMRALRSDGTHFLRALRAFGSKDLQRILRSDPNDANVDDFDEAEFNRGLRQSDHFLRSLRSPKDFMRMVRSGDSGSHFLRSLRDLPSLNEEEEQF